MDTDDEHDSEPGIAANRSASLFPGLAGEAGESTCWIVQPWSSRGHAAAENACIQGPFDVLCPP